MFGLLKRTVDKQRMKEYLREFKFIILGLQEIVINCYNIILELFLIL